MRHILRTGLAIALSAGLLLADEAVEAQVPSAADRGYMNIDDSIGPAGESREAQIARATAAGPKHVAD
jgi:hypothetical protein